jgi:hypothetical protein
MKFDLKSLPDNTFLPFVATLFHLTIPLISKEKDYYYIFLFVANCNPDKSFQVFQEELINYSKKNPDDIDTLVGLINFYLSFESNNQEINIKWKSKIRDFVVTILSKSNKSSFEYLDKTSSKRNNLKEWLKIKEKVDEIRSHTFSGKIDNFFSSIFKKKEK